jgi:hypothetical protein
VGLLTLPSRMHFQVWPVRDKRRACMVRWKFVLLRFIAAITITTGATSLLLDLVAVASRNPMLQRYQLVIYRHYGFRFAVVAAIVWFGCCKGSGWRLPAHQALLGMPRWYEPHPRVALGGALNGVSQRRN